MSRRARLGEGRAESARRPPGLPRPAERPGDTGRGGRTGWPTWTKALPDGKAVTGVAGGTEPSASLVAFSSCVFGRVLTLTLASPCGDPRVPSPWPRVFCGYFNRFCFCYFFYACFSIYGSISLRVRDSSFPKSGKGLVPGPYQPDS